MKEKTTLLIVEPDEHYISHVAKPALKKGLISDFITVTRDEFAAALDRLDRTRLVIAKGMLETADFLRPILKYSDKALISGGKDGFLSHCTVLLKRKLFGWTRPLILTDAAINIAPAAEQKVRIVQNALNMARKMLEIAKPIVSILTPAGKLNPAIQSSVDGDFVAHALPDENIRLDQMDTALSADARAAKKLSGGIADILLADNLDSGNNIYKLHTMRGGYLAAGIVCGTTVPVILNSRSDESTSKLLSLKFAIKLLG